MPDLTRPWSDFDHLVDSLSRLLVEAKNTASRSVDSILTARNWLVGAWIIAYEQEGADRARYGERLLASLAESFEAKRIPGLSVSNLKNCRQIAATWPRLGIRQTLSGESAPELPGPAETLPWQNDEWMARLRSSLSFSTLLELTRIEEPLARAFYELEAVKSGWSVRELRRQRNTLLYERVGLSRDKDAVMAMAETGRIVETAATELRDPVVLEFLGLGGRAPKDESELEKALIDHLEEFLLELGRDFCFMGRQFRLTVGGRHYFVDLLFFHRRLRCLIAIDLKMGRFGHEDAGQMHFYLNFLRENVSLPDENPPVGLILCSDKDAADVHYATVGMDQQIFVSRYLVALPTEEQLRKWLIEEQDALAASLPDHGEGTP